MSQRGRRVTRFDFEQRWSEGHRAGKVHPFERSRILAGDYSPIIRELEPEFKLGQTLVLSQSRPLRSVEAGRAIIAPPSPLFVITVNRKVRRKAGDWATRFDVLDRREPRRLVRRKPPALREGEYVAATEEEIRQAAVDSAYTGNPKAAVDHLEAVDDFTLRRQTAAAKESRERGIHEMLASMEEVRSALDERVQAQPELAQEIGRELWAIRSRIDDARRKLKRRMVA